MNDSRKYKLTLIHQHEAAPHSDEVCVSAKMENMDENPKNWNLC